MKYCEVYIRGTKGIFSWHTDSSVQEGSRVRVKLRGKSKIGIVVKISQEVPKFKTQPIIEILDLSFLPPASLSLASELSHKHYCSLEKVLSLMVPAKFFASAEVINYRSVLSLVSPPPEKLPRGEKQRQLLEQVSAKPELSLGELKKDFPIATIRKLVEQGYLVLEEQGIEVPERTSFFKLEIKDHDLTKAQSKALYELEQSERPSLLFGVTGSGKTELYKRLIQDNEKQSLYLVPEIALTPQLIAEFCQTFGDKVALWHSGLSAGEKVQEWGRIVSGEARLLIGTRSSVLLPFKELGLVIMDEEHEWTYKNETLPRFWTHDVVQYYVDHHHVKSIFGSATPRVESWYKAKAGIWNLVNLSERVFAQESPEITLVDMKQEYKKGNYTPLSESLVRRITQGLERGEQGVVFLNKRGYAGSMLCRCCGHVFGCDDCDVGMKLHQNPRGARLICHLCGRMENVPDKCPECGEPDFQLRGWGTQQVEEALLQNFPKLRILRADRDTITGRYDFEKLLASFKAGEADVLLGTQMIAKGLDIPKVAYSAMILADVGLSLPDFRSEEKVFQLLMQTAGRSGRAKGARADIVVQTFQPEHKVFDFFAKQTVEGFLDNQLEERSGFKKPPYSQIVKFIFSDHDKAKAFIQAKTYHKLLDGAGLPVHVVPAFFPKNHGKYFFHVLLTVGLDVSIEDILKKHPPDNARVDIDPASIL